MPFGLWEFLFMAFGLRNATQALQRLKNNILMGLDYVFSFLDDDGSSANPESSTGPTSARCLPSLLPMGWPSSWRSACSLSRSWISWATASPPPASPPLRDNIQVILDFPKPADFKSQQRFLGMMNFYHRFLLGIAGTLRPLTAALSGTPRTSPGNGHGDSFWGHQGAPCHYGTPGPPPPGGRSRPCYGRLRHPCRSGPTATGRPALTAAGVIQQKALQNRGKLLQVRPRTARRRVRYKTFPLAAGRPPFPAVDGSQAFDFCP
jgi:hypothetical protein